MLGSVLTVAGLAVTSVLAHANHEDQTPIAGPHKQLWYNTLPGDGGTQVCFCLTRWMVHLTALWEGHACELC